MCYVILYSHSLRPGESHADGFCRAEAKERTMFMNQQWKRFLSLALALLMVMGMVSVQAFATENVAETEEPAVTETVEATEEPAVTETVETSAPEEPTDPVPETTEDPDPTAVPETTEAPDQTLEPEEDAAVKSVQALIDALPEVEAITEANREEVETLLEAIDEAKAELSDEELAELNFDKYEAAASALGEDHTPAPLTETPLSVTQTDMADTNGDGEINAYDAWLILKYVAGDTVEGSKIGDSNGDAIGDVNGDGAVMNSDARLILKYLVGLQSIT